MEFQRIAPVLTVDTIEPCIEFWKDLLGFTEVTQVKDETGIYQFVLLSRDAVTVMYQTPALLTEDLPDVSPRDLQTSCQLYINVDDLDTVDQALVNVPRFLARRHTFYGAHEFGVREPGGNMVIFAHKPVTP